MDVESIILFKPDAKEIIVHGRNNQYLLHELGALLLQSMGMKISAHNELVLTEDDVRNIYSKVLCPNPEDDAIWGTEWKNEVIEHMISGPVDAYLVQCNDGLAIEKVKAVKRYFRTAYSSPNNVVQNVAHVPDEDEFETARRILFKHE